MLQLGRANERISCIVSVRTGALHFRDLVFRFPGPHLCFPRPISRLGAPDVGWAPQISAGPVVVHRTVPLRLSTTSKRTLCIVKLVPPKATKKVNSRRRGEYRLCPKPPGMNKAHHVIAELCFPHCWGKPHVARPNLARIKSAKATTFSFLPLLFTFTFSNQCPQFFFFFFPFFSLFPFIKNKYIINGSLLL